MYYNGGAMLGLGLNNCTLVCPPPVTTPLKVARGDIDWGAIVGFG